VTVFESKPVCSIHKQSIEQIKDGVAKWRCPKAECKSKEIGYSNKLISDIWMRFWDDEAGLKDFQRSIGFYELLFNTPSEVLTNSIRKHKDIELIVEETEIQQKELIKKEKAKLEEIEAQNQKANLNSDFIKSMIKKNNTCSSCGILPAFDGSCAC
tara:strand:+ start:294 stop:761 length:468 start_codon:yes stop_codon:yes gene_type:complete